MRSYASAHRIVAELFSRIEILTVKVTDLSRVSLRLKGFLRGPRKLGIERLLLGMGKDDETVHGATRLVSCSSQWIKPIGAQSRTTRRDRNSLIRLAAVSACSSSA